MADLLFDSFRFSIAPRAEPGCGVSKHLQDIIPRLENIQRLIQLLKSGNEFAFTKMKVNELEKFGQSRNQLS